jgi:hypothetical protein
LFKQGLLFVNNKAQGHLPHGSTKTEYQLPKKIGSILLKVVLGIFLLVIVLVLLLLTPPVQRFAVNKAENFLEKKLGTRVEIGGISIGLPRKVVLSNIYLEDKTRDTFIVWRQH